MNDPFAYSRQMGGGAWGSTQTHSHTQSAHSGAPPAAPGAFGADPFTDPTGGQMSGFSSGGAALPAAGSMGTIGGSSFPAGAHTHTHTQSRTQAPPAAEGGFFGGWGSPTPDDRAATGAPSGPGGPMPAFGAQVASRMFQDPTCQAIATMGMNYGREVVASGLAKYMPGAAALWQTMRYYFHVNNSFVKNRILVRARCCDEAGDWTPRYAVPFCVQRLIFPWRARNWVRLPVSEALGHGSPHDGGQGPRNGPLDAGAGGAGDSVTYAPPVHDENAPDMYLPLMAFVTFVLLTGLLKGTRASFSPEDLSNAMSSALVATVLEVALLRVGIYIINAPACSLFDLTSYTSYKYVGLVINMLIGLIFGRGFYYMAFFYTAAAMAYFFFNTLTPIVRPELYHGGMAGVSKSGGSHKNYFVIAAAVFQFLMMWWLVPSSHM